MAACDLNTSTQPSVRNSHQQLEAFVLVNGWMEVVRSTDSWLKAFGSVNG